MLQASDGISDSQLRNGVAELVGGGFTTEELQQSNISGCCGKHVQPLTNKDIVLRMSALPHWRISPDRKTISKDVVAKNWDAAVAMLNEISPLANSEGHHPDYHISGYRNVRVDLTTHSIGGLSLPDFVMAAKIDTLDVAYSPKWLREKTDQMQHEARSSLNVASESDIEAVQARVSAVERYMALGNDHDIEGLLGMLANPCDMFGEEASKDGMEWYFSNYKGVRFSVTKAPRAIAPGDPYTMRIGYKRSWDSVSRENAVQQRLTVDVDEFFTLNEDGLITHIGYVCPPSDPITED